MGSDSSAIPVWSEQPLEELTSANITYGVVQPGNPTSDGVPMVRVTNFSGHTLSLGEVMRISSEVERKYERTRLRSGDVLITVVGSVGQVAIVPPELTGWNIARAVALVRPMSPDLSRWIALFLRSPIAQHRMGIAANTTVQTTVNLKDLRTLSIPLPSLPVRQEICGLLGALDDRIDNLHQANATLEAVAQALFKSWFVDFAPVRTKAEGREPEGMDAATAALFPSEFEDSELGLIPKGWRCIPFGDVATLSKGSVSPMAAPAREFRHYSLPAFDAGKLPLIEQGESIKSNKTPVPSDAVLVSKLNPHIPRIWFVGDVGPDAVCSTEFLVWTPKPGVGSAFVYALAASPAFNSAMRQMVTGTSNSHQRVRPDQLAEVQAAVISDGALAGFEAIVAPMLRQVEHNRRRAAALAETRDTLLPRLISGRLRLRKPKPLKAYGDEDACK